MSGLFGLVLAVTGGAFCTTTQTAPGGLEIIVGTDLETPQSFDTIRVRLSQQSVSGGWNTLLNETRTIPTEIKLPAMYSIEAGRSSDQEALIQVSAIRGATTLVERDVQLQVPSDRVAELQVVLSSACIGITCPSGQSCDPTSHACGSDRVMTSSLPSFKSGDQFKFDAGALVLVGPMGAKDASAADVAAAETDAGSDSTIESCSPGAMQCSGQQPQACSSAGAWVNNGGPCVNQTCVSGACTGVCAPNQTTCSGGTGQQTCTASGTWGATQQCPVTCLSNSCQTIKAISTGLASQTCALMSGGGVQCWGYNEEGEVGNGTAGADTATPGPVSGLSSGAIAVATGGNFSCALLTGGTVDCWGANGVGQLGNGTTTTSYVPVQVSGLSGATAIATGGTHACAIESNGSIACWGSNIDGELGNGSSTGPQACVSGTTSNVCSMTPVQVQGITNAIAIGAGQNITCALLANDTVDCWGQGGFLGFSQNSATPVAISGLSGVTSVAVGAGTICALLSGGTVDCWGSDYYAQLGNGTANEVVASPAPVMNLSGAVAISAGYVGACALLSNGTVDCWGDNGDGEIGTGSTTGPETCTAAKGPFQCANVATPVSVVSGVTQISTGSDGSCALLATGNAYCWGYGASGTLGNNSLSTTPVSTPGPVVW